MSAETRPDKRRNSMLKFDAAGVVLCLMLAGAWYLFSVEPVREARAERRALLAELEPRLERVTALESTHRTKRAELSTLGKQIQEGKLQLRPVDAVNQRLSDLTRYARDHGLRLDEVRPGSPEPTQWFNLVPIRLTGVGTYNGLGAFLHSVPTAFLDVAVTGFEIRGQPEAIDMEPRFILDLVWYAAPSSEPKEIR